MNELIWQISIEAYKQYIENMGSQITSASFQKAFDEVTTQTSRTESSLEVLDGVALIKIHGMITPEPDFMALMFGGGNTTIKSIRMQLREALERDDVSSILLEVNSGGGVATGIDELAAELFQARHIKRIYTQVTGTMASAAYYLGSQANRIFASSRTNAGGSIGTYMLLTDRSEQAKREGIKIISIDTGLMKTVAVPGVAITPAQIDRVRDRVEQLQEFFEQSVLRSRNIDPDDFEMITDTADVFLAETSVELGLFDGIQHPGKTVAQLRAATQNAGDIRKFTGEF